MFIDVYGIGNPLIDIISSVSEDDLKMLGKKKGSMHLIDEKEREKILELILDREITYQCGGSCPNTMISLSYFGCKTVLSGSVGLDEYGARYIENLAKSGTVSNVVRTDDAPTGTSIILLTPDSERTMNTYLGANRMYLPEHIDENLLSKSRYFYFTGYMWDTEKQREAILKAIDICSRNNISVAFDAADPFAVERHKDDFLDIIRKYVKILFANKEEAQMLCGSDDVDDNLKMFEETVPVVTIKLGSKGSVTGGRGRNIYHNITPAAAVDTTGAGDMFAAGFLYGLIKGCTPYKAADYASYTAAELVKVRGARFSPEGYKKIKAGLDEKNSCP